MNKPMTLVPDSDNAIEFEDEFGAAGAAGSEQLARTLRALWSTVYRNRLLMTAIVAVSLLAGLGATLLMTPQYEATATLQIDQQSTNVLGEKGQDSLDQSASMQDADRFLQTQADVLQSTALATLVMQDLGLASNDSFVRAMGVKPVTKPAGTLSLADTKRQQILGILSHQLKIVLPRTSRIVTIHFTSPSAKLSARIANAFASDFMIFNMNKKFGSSGYARNFLEGQLSDTRTKLESSERALLQYARGAHLLDVSAGMASSGSGDSSAGGATHSLTASNLLQLNDAYAQAQAARVAAEEHWDEAKNASPMELQEVITNPAVMQLSQLKAQAQASYQQDLQRHKPDYPQMQQAAAHIAELDRQLSVLASGIRGSIQQQYLTALKQEQALAGQVKQLKGSTEDEQSRSVEYNILKRAVDTNRTMYDGLLQRYSEVSAQAGVAANNITQIDVAGTPVAPVSPRPFINLLIAGFAGILLAGGFVLLRDKFDDSVRTPEDVSTKLGLTFLNSIPLIADGSTPQESLDDPRSMMSEAYAALRTSIELSHKGGARHTLAVTSTRQSEGKSTTAYAVARAFAKMGRRSVIVDADLRKPSIHRLLNVQNDRGLSSVLAGLASVSSVLQETDVPNLSSISAGPLSPNPAELLSGTKFSEVVAELGELFDTVILDAPPVLGLADIILIGTATGATLFVVEANGSHHGHAKAAVRRLKMGGVDVIGAVLTKYDARKIGYGYGYGYNYTYAYSYGSESAAEDKPKSWLKHLR